MLTGQIESVWLSVFQELRGAWGELYYKVKECKGHPRAASRAEGEGRAAGSLALGMESGDQRKHSLTYSQT